MGTDLYESDDATFYLRLIGGPCDKCHVPGGLILLATRARGKAEQVQVCYLCFKELLTKVEEHLEC